MPRVEDPPVNGLVPGVALGGGTGFPVGMMGYVAFAAGAIGGGGGTVVVVGTPPRGK